MLGAQDTENSARQEAGFERRRPGAKGRRRLSVPRYPGFLANASATSFLSQALPGSWL